ncbi:H+transporting two-sector ATPase E subunit [Desulfarculus baarsii DSM 2075]|uniref:H+transporting two-sector ATPase E subunit n=1 Tax=Desulfarculus baarsii (strain ATCC 33931 / DSM 2075 / LMG 7858 / VKM B-1802 / 2st14) TaxID=644282 RepID=E1QGW9_DESB2|nr:H+transporting two-sector ATPase E subunit [Desulfarculus baarsii]ADK84812.1 H+transporting two-sector ATPase E subunit [Desulfarculus baarsii DSM 2075]
MADAKLQELIDVLRKQGVESGEDSARQIVASAEKEAERILAQARTEAEAVVTKAQSEADNLKKRLESSLEIAASQFVTNLKSQVEESLLVLPLRQKLDENLADESLLKGLIAKLVENYSAGSPEDDMKIILGKDAGESLKSYVLGLGAKVKLSQDLESYGARYGLVVELGSGKVRVDFTDEAFLALFLRFLSPAFREMFRNVKVGKAAQQ